MYICILHVVFKLFLYMPLCRLSLHADWKELRKRQTIKTLLLLDTLVLLQLESGKAPGAAFAGMIGAGHLIEAYFSLLILSLHGGASFASMRIYQCARYHRDFF